MAASDPTSDVATPTGVLQGVAAYSWDGSAWQPAGRAGPSVATPTGVLQGVAPFSWDGSAWQPTGRAGPGVATPTGVLDGVAVYTWTGSVWTPASGQPTPSTPSGALRGVAAFNWDGSAWQPAGQAGPDVPTPFGVLQGVAMFNWTGTAWAAASALPPGASLSLDFMTPGTLDPLLTFTRASTATYFDATGTLQSAATNAPRWDYSPTALTLNGLLIEEARTNSIRNSTAAGAVPGSPGTMPTNWLVGGGAAVTPQVIGTGTENGVPYIDLRFSGTTASTGIQIIPESTTAIAAANGQIWAASAYIRLVAGTLNNFGALNLWINETTAAGAGVKSNVGPNFPAITSASLSTQRQIYSVALTGGGTVGAVHPRIVFNTVNGVAIDATFRIGAPQMEQGAGATSYIPTSSVAVTRAAEGCTAPTGAWFNAAASSLAADFMVAQASNPSLVNSRSPAGLSDGTANNRMRLYGQQSSGSNTAAIATTVAGVNTNSAALGTTAANVTLKLAGAWSGTTAAGSLNGAAAASQSVGIPSGLTTLAIGDEYPASTSYLNGWVRRVRYWNRALSAVELQSVTT